HVAHSAAQPNPYRHEPPHAPAQDPDAVLAQPAVRRIADRRLDHRRVHSQPAAPRDLALNRHAHHPFEHTAEEVALQQLPQADEGLGVGHRTAPQAAEVPVRDAAAYLPLELLVAPGLEMLEHHSRNTTSAGVAGRPRRALWA